MSNRLVCEYVDGRWVADGQVLGGAPVQSVPTGAPRWPFGCAARTSALHPPERSRPADHTTAKVTVVDAEYAGRHMDVVVQLGRHPTPGTCLERRLPAAGPAASRPGDRLVASFRPADAMVYPAEADRPPTPKRVGELVPGRAASRRRDGRGLSVATGTVAGRRRRGSDARSVARSIAKPLGIVVFIGALGYLVLEPLDPAPVEGVRRRRPGLPHRVHPKPGIGKTILTTVELALGSLAIALVLGTFLAWCASRLPPRLRILRVIPVLPIVVPAIASVVGWAFLLSPRPGYLNAALRNLPWWSDLDEGPIDIYTVPWIVIITGIGPDRVRLPVRQRRVREHQRRTARGGPGRRVVTVGCVLPGDAAAAAAHAHLRRRHRPAARSRPVHRPAPPGQHRRDQRRSPPTSTATCRRRRCSTAPPPPSARPCSCSASSSCMLQKMLLGNQRRFVTHGGKAFRAPGRPSRWAAVALRGLHHGGHGAAGRAR